MRTRNELLKLYIELLPSIYVCWNEGLAPATWHLFSNKHITYDEFLVLGCVREAALELPEEEYQKLLGGNSTEEKEEVLKWRIKFLESLIQN
jgi:hypothetical protein